MSGGKPVSEVQLQRELENSRLSGAGDASESGGTQIRIRRVEVGKVDDVETLAPRFETQLLRYNELAAEGLVHPQSTRGTECVPPEGTECSYRIGYESRRVDPLSRGLCGRIRVAQNLIGPVA